jgi:hypothetical protein
MSVVTETNSTNLRRAGYFTLALLLVNLVNDGWNGRPSLLEHQLLILPFTCLFLFSLIQILLAPKPASICLWTPRRALALALLSELTFPALYLYEARHFALFGYILHPAIAAAVFLPFLTLLVITLWSRLSPTLVFLTTLAAYAGGLLLSILSFPLNYLRSDMLPVIVWADNNLLHHIDPYITLHVADRIYDFPYLPGMMLAFFPFAALHLDLRFGSMAYVLGLAVLVFWAARCKPSDDRRLEVTSLLALFLLCPFLQYRHELYLQPHWFALVLGFVLMQRRHFVWAAVAFGVGMAVYQFSWIIFPFFVLNALRRRGWLEALKLAFIGVVTTLVIVGPFLESASHRIASNTVSQWGLMPHAHADPINLSYWATYLIHPDHLLRLQAVLMIAIFLYCFGTGRCRDLADTLRWMIVALATFILLNVLVDSYFFLMLLVVVMVYVCVANDWWAEPATL